MSHVDSEPIHAYANRGLDVRVSVVTAEAHTDFTDITFRAGSIEQTDLAASDTATGFDVDLTLTALELDITAATFRWELAATFGGEVRTLAQGPFTLDPEPTEDVS